MAKRFNLTSICKLLVLAHLHVPTFKYDMLWKSLAYHHRHFRGKTLLLHGVWLCKLLIKRTQYSFSLCSSRLKGPPAGGTRRPQLCASAVLWRCSLTPGATRRRNGGSKAARRDKNTQRRHWHQIILLRGCGERSKGRTEKSNALGPARTKRFQRLSPGKNEALLLAST